MHLTIVRHVPLEDAGLIQPLLSRAGHQIRYTESGEPIQLEQARALILMGGPMSVNDPAPWVAGELAAIENAMGAGIPVLGICLGAQLIAKALGAPVYRNRVKEIGWYPVWWRREASSDPLFHSLTGPETVFHWHGETFDLPSGAVWLASSERCAHQAFRYGNNVYALQFHLEVTADMIASWCEQDANCGGVRELDQPVDPGLNMIRQTEVAELVFGRWAGTFLGAP